jgi:hypothetical protein
MVMRWPSHSAVVGLLVGSLTCVQGLTGTTATPQQLSLQMSPVCLVPGGTWKKVTGPYGKKVIQGPHARPPPRPPTP